MVAHAPQLAPDPRANRLLAALPLAEYERLAPRLTIAPIDALDVLMGPGEPLADAYFPLTGIISLVAVDAEGRMVEVATIGIEGMAGLHTVLGADTTPFQLLGQVPGLHARLPLPDLLAAAVPGTVLHTLLLRYAQARAVLSGQSAACNRLHPVEERCARWLLTAHDRVRTPTFRLTHEVLGQMLGVRRATVSLALATLQRAGLIAYHRGTVTILDRPGLEAAACECYAIINTEFAHLLGAP